MGDPRENYRSDPYYNPARDDGMEYIEGEYDTIEGIRCKECGKKRYVKNGEDHGCENGCEGRERLPVK